MAALSELFQYAITLHQNGTLDEAQELYRRILTDYPNNVVVLNNLSLIIGGEEAETLLRRAIALKPDYLEAHMNLGENLRNRGRPDEAIPWFQQAIALRPDYIDAHYCLGTTLLMLGRNQEAVPCLEQAFAFAPSRLEIRNNLFAALSLSGQFLLSQNKFEEVESFLRRATVLDPDNAVIWFNMGYAFFMLGRREEALASYDMVLRIRMDWAEAHTLRGHVLRELGRLNEALVSYDAALRLKPDFIEVHYNRGVVLKKLGRLDEALASYDAALRHKPDLAEAHYSRGNALIDLGRLDEALASLKNAHSLDRKMISAVVTYKLLMPRLMHDQEEIDRWRDGYAQKMGELDLTIEIEEDKADFLDPHIFYHAYHARANASIFNKLSTVFRRIRPALQYNASHIARWCGPVSRRIRIGICSRFLYSHTIGKLFQGLIRYLDRTKFEVIVIHIDCNTIDATRESINKSSDGCLVLFGGLNHKQNRIAELALDVLLYPDIGMHSGAYFLAHARLAPVQVVSWGHPETTGIDTIDYFLSSDLIEPESAENNYHEHLIRLDRLPCMYQPLVAPTTIPSRTAIGLPENITLYGCPQSLFKFHPDMDMLLQEIVDGEESARIVLIDSNNRYLRTALSNRWRVRAPIINERVIWLPSMQLDNFMALMAHIDVLLDPVHFGSGNTFYEGMVYGTPVVTWPGTFMRGRIVAGAYRQMKLSDAPVVENINDYAKEALTWGLDSVRRSRFRSEARQAAAQELFGDMKAVRSIEAFLIAAVDGAARAKKLPKGLVVDGSRFDWPG